MKTVGIFSSPWNSINLLIQRTHANAGLKEIAMNRDWTRKWEWARQKFGMQHREKSICVRLESRVNVLKINRNFVDTGVSDWRCVCIGPSKMSDNKKKLHFQTFSSENSMNTLIWKLLYIQARKMHPFFLLSRCVTMPSFMLAPELDYICHSNISLCFSSLSTWCFQSNKWW